jgi:putative hemolysin
VASERRTAQKGYPVLPKCLPTGSIDDGRYEVRFARTPAELEAVQRLRFEVFNLELGEGLEESHDTGLDVDRFDAVCHHMLVIHKPTGAVVGTYRMQTSVMAAEHFGFYSAEEFTVDELPAEVIADSIELGRACVGLEFRNRHVLFLLWRGLASYLSHNRKRYLFGCCSLTSQDPVEGRLVMDFLAADNKVHPTYRVRPQPGWECYGPDFHVNPEDATMKVKVPRLFNLYLRYGALVCGDPALDRSFKTIDYLVLFDLNKLNEKSRGMFFK